MLNQRSHAIGRAFVRQRGEDLYLVLGLVHAAQSDEYLPVIMRMARSLKLRPADPQLSTHTDDWGLRLV